MIDFPASPTNGQQFTAQGVTWVWDGAKWTALGLSNAQATPIGDNRIVNGDMRIDQRNSGAGGTATGYTIDRWSYSATQANKGTWGRASSVLAAALGFPNVLNFTSASAYTPAAGEFFSLSQPIEADMVNDFAWGTSNAQPVTLSFWVNSSLTGLFGGSIRNYPLPSTRSYPFSFNVVAGWQKIVITIPGDTAGTWVMSGNAAAFALHFDLGAGATFRGPAGAWASANYTSANGAVSVVATNGAVFQITGVKLEIGSVATPYPRQSLAKSLADCQRYYQSFASVLASGNGVNSQAITNQFTFPVSMRAAPTAAFSGQTYTNASNLNLNTIDTQTLRINLTITATGYGNGFGALTLSAEL